jgi:hypothetical protein
MLQYNAGYEVGKWTTIYTFVGILFGAILAACYLIIELTFDYLSLRYSIPPTIVYIIKCALIIITTLYFFKKLSKTIDKTVYLCAYIYDSVAEKLSRFFE